MKCPDEPTFEQLPEPFSGEKIVALRAAIEDGRQKIGHINDYPFNNGWNEGLNFALKCLDEAVKGS